MKAGKVINKYKNLSEPVKASFWYTICNVLNKGIALLSTPIFTRILTEEQYGTFSIFQSWFSIILIFTSFNIFLGGYTKGLLLYRDKRDEFTSSLLSLTTLITMIFAAAYVLNIDFWTDVFELSPVLMLAMFIELLTMPALEFWSARERFDYRYKKYVAISVAMSILSLGGGVVAVLSTSCKVEARVYSDVIAKAIFAGTLFVLVLAKGRKFFDRAYWKYALAFNLPLIPHYLSNYVLNQSDRLMIGRMAGAGQAAYYSVAYTISTMAVLITTSINNSLTPYIYKSIDTGEKTGIKKATQPLILLVAGLSVLTMAFAPEIILLFAGRKYADAIYVIPPIAASVFFIFLYSLFSTIEYFYQKTGFIAVATCISAGLNLVLNYLFISLYGYYAAGYTTLVCYICLAVMHYAFYKKVLRKEMPEIRNLYDMKLILVTASAVLLVMLAMAFTYHMYLIRYGIIVILFAVGIGKRKKIAAAIRGFSKKK